MVLRQYLQTEPVVSASYLFGCAGKGEAAIIDPIATVDRYFDDAARLGVAIRYVIDTHVHADHVSAAREISAATGAEYVLWSGAQVQFPFRAVNHGETLGLGNVTIKVLHTPGHTPEHISLLVTDTTRAEEPWLIFTGHTLMVGDMGRTELASSAADGAAALFASSQLLKQLPDYVELMPGAFSGSVCGRGLSGKASSTIGFERRYNRAFRIAAEAEFVELMLKEIPPRPQDAELIRSRNLGLMSAHA